MRLMQKLIAGLLAFLFFANISMIAIAVYWANEGFGETAHSRTVLTPVVKKGGDFKIAVDITRSKKCASQMKRSFIDAKGTPWPIARKGPSWEDEITGWRINEAGRKKFTLTIPLPEAIANGPAIYHVTMSWACNPLQYQWPNFVELEDATFTVVDDSAAVGTLN